MFRVWIEKLPFRKFFTLNTNMMKPKLVFMNLFQVLGRRGQRYQCVFIFCSSVMFVNSYSWSTSRHHTQSLHDGSVTSNIDFGSHYESPCVRERCYKSVSTCQEIIPYTPLNLTSPYWSLAVPSILFCEKWYQKMSTSILRFSENQVATRRLTVLLFIQLGKASRVLKPEDLKKKTPVQ